MKKLDYCYTPNRRNNSAAERSADRGVLTGYAAVFYRSGDPGTEYHLWEDCAERIGRTAFDRALRERQDVRAFFNHDESQVLGRVSAGTLRLSVDSVGLRYSVDLPDSSIGRDVAELVARGDVTGSSLMFFRRGFEETREGDRLILTITDVDLVEVGPVTFPAYKATTAQCNPPMPKLTAWQVDQQARARLALLLAGMPIL